MPCSDNGEAEFYAKKRRLEEKKKNKKDYGMNVSDSDLLPYLKEYIDMLTKWLCSTTSELDVSKIKDKKLKKWVIDHRNRDKKKK